MAVARRWRSATAAAFRTITASQHYDRTKRLHCSQRRQGAVDWPTLFTLNQYLRSHRTDLPRGMFKERAPLCEAQPRALKHPLVRALRYVPAGFLSHNEACRRIYG